MGNTLGVPVGYAVKRPFTHENGISTGIKEVVAHSYLEHTYKRKRRFDLYNFLTDDYSNLETINFAIPQLEVNSEHPRELENLSDLDSIFFFGFNSSQEKLVVKISRNKEGATAFVLLTLQDGKTYTLPGDKLYLVPSRTSPECFSAGGLRLRCVEAMRRWRISFNGLLRKHLREDEAEEETPDLVHAKFSFIWHASSFLYDLNYDIPTKELANYLSKEKWKGYLPDLNRLSGKLDSYIQAGFIQGTYQFDGQNELEVYLWGARKRSFERFSLEKPWEEVEHFAYLEEGEMVYIGSFGPIGLNANADKLLHGCIVLGNSLGGSVHDCSLIEDRDNDTISFKRDTFSWEATFKKQKESSFTFHNANNSWSSLMLTPVQMNDQNGYGLRLTKMWISGSPALEIPEYFLPDLDPESITRSSQVVSLKEPSCREASLTGGKGASLADLHHLSSLDSTVRLPTFDNYKEIISEIWGYNGHVSPLTEFSFSVPRGVVVTTTAFEEFLKDSLLCNHISNLEIAAWKPIPVDLQKECKRVSSLVSDASLPDSIKGSIRNALKREFGEDLENIRFAVRSSASGEDSEDMSAAGQMKTFLGVKGLNMRREFSDGKDNGISTIKHSFYSRYTFLCNETFYEKVYEAVVKCWASQFDFTAVQYKRQNGQILNAPMAVVIQEMVAAEVAGVMFTCDPVTGNPAKITITSNYGIGESVVSASAEPDTTVVNRNQGGESYVDSVEMGAKKTLIVMTDSGVIEEEISGDFSILCSLSSDLAKQLADIGVQVEEAYGCLMDIEWAIKNNQIFLLQARPVTTFDKETDFEIAHESDSPLRSEKDYSSTANVGEVFPGAMSQLAVSTFNKGAEVVVLKIWLKRNKTAFPWSPYYKQGMVTNRNHMMFSVLDSLMRFYHGKHTLLSTTQCLALCGRILDDPEMLRLAQRRNAYFPNVFAPLVIVYMLSDLVFANKRLKRRKKHFPVGSKMEMPLSYTAEEIYFELSQQLIQASQNMISHFECTSYSSFCNLFLVMALSGNTGELSTEALSDFAYILSNCPDVESVQVPNAIENLARQIMDTREGEGFHELKPKEALMWLERTDLQVGQDFQTLLKNHGHRCFQEFDLYSTPWRSDPVPLVKTIQEMVAKRSFLQRSKAPESTEETLKKLQVPLNWKTRLFMRVIIPFCRKGVSLREGGKSLMINVVDCMRYSYRRLAEQMVLEGRLPDKELLYFLSHFEILELLRTRSPRLIQKAFRRRAVHPTLSKLVFPEICQGIPKPIDYSKKEPVQEGSFKMMGVPVSQGSATGFARVATSLEEAQDLQAGEILIAYSTDIGWSPYFPLLGGVATELGGLVSHGAVVAREYGLPCVVGVHGATLKFNTGDKVFIDGTRGILSKLDE